MKKTAISIVLMFVCFIISGLFFLSSGVIDSDTAEIDKSHTKQILHELNRIPFIHMDVDDINLDNDEYRYTNYQKRDCDLLKQDFDEYVMRSKLPIFENSDSLCYGLNMGSDFENLTPKWAVGKLINIIDDGNFFTFKGNVITTNIAISSYIKSDDDDDYEIGEFYKIDMNNICRHFFMMVDSRYPSSISSTFVEPKEVNCH
ncbi:hypothetical protein HN827_09450 [archaeon]|jgi:hypothetical protein|nr:hypothetical protein [archaeon]MBT4648602.1 hypothetical protein [archaeon]MBT6821431.1 hypothetical protein [archaeon]MBT7393026.1 hypothetical protein [archaeon]